MKLQIKDLDYNKTINKETDGLTWIECNEFSTNTQIFFPDEIAIEVGCNYASADGGETWDINDIRHDIECYFTNDIESILEKTIEFIQSYGDNVE